MSRYNMDMGNDRISSLLMKLSFPAMAGMMVMVFNQIIDTIYIGRGIGTMAIAGMAIVLPIATLIQSMGMSVGVGGASVISRSLGEGNQDKASKTYGSLITLSAVLGLLAVTLGLLFEKNLLTLFGAKGEIYEPAHQYYGMTLLGIPVLMQNMVANNAMRAEGAPRQAMLVMVIAAVTNIILDPIFIFALGWGIKGAAAATSVSYFVAQIYANAYFRKKKSKLTLKLEYLKPDFAIYREAISVGIPSFARQSVTSVMTVVINNLLLRYGGELSVAVYGIVMRVMTFSLMPMFGLVQGFLPIAGFNFGARKAARVKTVLKTAIIAGTVISIGVFFVIQLMSHEVVAVFSQDNSLIDQSALALTIIYAASPLVAFQMLGASFFQAIGKGRPALFLTLTRQGIFLLPLIVLLPLSFGLKGVWYAFPTADVLSTAVTLFFIMAEIRRLEVVPSKA
ncbi:MATE family efflux transporter [Limibacter armeniacum]|uniref:MATE family efflux transporter n=1 Tax=Limibacter armeniacum TaxID=466084 RepID=UPI002FE592CD